LRPYEDLLEKALAELPKEVVRRDRFEVPKVSVQGWGSRTIIKNFAQLTKAVNRGEEHVFKYILRSLGTAGFLESGRVILQGKFTEEEIQNEVEAYVKNYVLCKECGAPDTEFIKEGRILFIRCLACGAKHPARGI
jgi:translation initiation factor 2 subunit 2